MEVRWTVHVPQAMQQHGGGPRPRQDASATHASVQTAPALETQGGRYRATTARPDQPK